MAYRDLREYLKVLEKKGKLKRVKKEVDKDWEIAAVCRQLFYKFRDDQRPAVMFENVKGFTIPVVAGVLGASREIYALGLETDSVEGINRKWDHALGKLIPPRIVKDGPCKENICHGDKVDILKLPVPVWTVGEDPGPFFTSPYVITKDPETGVRNVGTYRMQVKGPSKTGFLIGKVQDASWHVKKNDADSCSGRDRRGSVNRICLRFENARDSRRVRGRGRVARRAGGSRSLRDRAARGAGNRGNRPRRRDSSKRA